LLLHCSTAGIHAVAMAFAAPGLLPGGGARFRRRRTAQRAPLRA